MVTIIAAITRDRALGHGGDMLYHISGDLKRFKALTIGHPIIMGRRTFESFPKGPLPGRRNLVVTRNPEYNHEGIETYPSLQAALESANDDSPYVLGGGQIYAQAMDLADCLEITEIDTDSEGKADTYFPEIAPDTWVAESVSEWHEDARSGVRYRFVTYKHVQR